ncbi:MAG TPA: hypothetical protein VMH80_00250 [Bryobacteraceae bacterium]|nr:hypothetical protein [Bryobacteraceae bacterium]
MGPGRRNWGEAAAAYARTVRGVRAFLGSPPPADPEKLVRSQLENRESAFLNTLKEVVFANPEHPYHRMFQLAGCTQEDLARLVKRAGLESALEQVRAAGVYLSQDEFKGEARIVRGGREIPASFGSFANPLAGGTIRMWNSGSRGKPVPTNRSPAFLRDNEALHDIATREFGLQDHAQIVIRPTLPSVLGLQTCAFGARQGHRMERWYAPGTGGSYLPATAFLVWLARRSGCPVPYPQYLRDNDFSEAAECVARLRRDGIPCTVSGPVSPAVRLAAAALDRKLDIRGTLFLVSGETLTDAKRAVIEGAGGEPFARYGIAEMGFIGHACRDMREGDCAHLYSNAIAAITYRRPAPLTDVEVNSLLFTTLLPTAPVVFINFEANDSGVLERAACDCTFSRIGLTTRIRDISSFGKLTGHGMTLVGTELVRLMEVVLPARIGGRPGDYQLVEREGAAQTTIELRVSPRVNGASPEKVRDCFISEIRRFYGGTLAGRVWQQAEALHVVILEPSATATGKVNPLHLLGGFTPR